jgi:GNAT superfamily N-acetyltransferase
MLWRVRTTLSDRPGSLARLARHCGERDVNILGLQIFPGVGAVTDELVLRVPEGWRSAHVASLVEGAGGADVSLSPCSEHALVDGPVQYLHALGRLARDPAMLPQVLAGLLDADSDAPGDVDGVAAALVATGSNADLSTVQDTMILDVGERQVVLRRTAPFTATEHARAVAFAEVAAELVGAHLGPDPATGARGPTPASGPRHPAVRIATLEDTQALTRMHGRCSTETVERRYGAPLARVDERFARRLLSSGGGALVAAVDSEVVALATLSACQDGEVEVSLLVEDGWQRRGLGTRLLSSAARLARGQGAVEVVLRSRAHQPALMSLAFACGMRARVRLEMDTVVVTVAVDGLKPLVPVPDRRTPGPPGSGRVPVPTRPVPTSPVPTSQVRTGRVTPLTRRVEVRTPDPSA